MRRVAAAALLLAASALLAQDSPKSEDPIAAQLLKEKEAYTAACSKAAEGVAAAFDKHFETVKNNKNIKIEAQLAQLEKIEAEKKAFEESGVPPTLPALKVAMSEYRAVQKKAEVVCKAAFEKAARAYKDKGELKTASDTLEEMKEFLAKAPTAGGGGAIVIACGVSNKVLGTAAGVGDGTKVMTADYVKGDQSQLWKIVPAGNGWVYVENVKGGNVMTAYGTGNGAEVVIAKKQTPASNNQLWKVTDSPASKGAKRLAAKPSGKFIGVDAKSKDAGARILLWTDQPTEASQVFAFTPPK